MKKIKSLMFLVTTFVLVASIAQAGLAPSNLPSSSYYQGRHSFSEDMGSGVVISGHLEFAVYTGTEALDAIEATGYEGDADYVYAYQVFNYQESDAAMTYFAVTGVDPATVESDNINAMEDFSGSGTGIEPSNYGFNIDQTKGVWEFNSTTLIQGEKSWFLFIYSDHDWIAGDIQLQAIYDDDVPVPINDGSNEIPEPMTLALLLGGVVMCLKCKK